MLVEQANPLLLIPASPNLDTSGALDSKHLEIYVLGNSLFESGRMCIFVPYFPKLSLDSEFYVDHILVVIC